MKDVNELSENNIRVALSNLKFYIHFNLMPGAGYVKICGDMIKPICKVRKLGLMPYQQAWDYQNALAEKIARGDVPETLLLLEHPHTYTFGRGGQPGNLVWSDEQLQSRGISVLWVDRGGDITYHGPGQLVGYPLLCLAPIGWEGERLPQVDYVGYIRKLEAVLIETLAVFGLNAFRIDGNTGVWVAPQECTAPKKIASIGVKVDSRGISRHGFALNVDPDMAYWEGIIPCGLQEVKMTSIAEMLVEAPGLEKVQNALIHCFADIFKRKLTIEKNVKEALPD